MNEAMHVLLTFRQSDTCFSAYQKAEKEEPTIVQNALEKGDYAFWENTSSAFTSGLVLLKVVAPEEVPAGIITLDWKKRLQDGFLLCEWRDAIHHQTGLGWFHKVLMIPLTKEGAHEYWDRACDPDWTWDPGEEPTPALDEAWRRHIAVRDNPETDVVPMVCVKCFSPNVILRLTQTIQADMNVFWNTEQEKYQAYSCAEHNEDFVGSLICLDCNWNREVTREDVMDLEGH